MTFERWEPHKHLELIEGWMRARGLAFEAGNGAFYPSTGFVVDRCVCAFVFLTNAPGVAYIDGAVSDPEAPEEKRREAFDALCKLLIAEAYDHGVELIVAFTTADSLIATCKANGFMQHGEGFTCIARRI